ncbi:MAG: hypothetical protein D8M57_17105 [Candidatus Scalindua sp. AMX11]|nr:MAG: hypothetical protein DWQ00_12550 [Candidatus Scalindua sp.]TDE63689.1 MAG: hypothetical protein D8M57_17105 [Candidatus Scalindua sp. AMX11]
MKSFTVKFIAILMAAFIGQTFCASHTFAWKPITHGYLAEQALNDRVLRPVQAPWNEGSYEIRLFGKAVDGQYSVRMRSNPIRVINNKKGQASASSFDP